MVVCQYSQLAPEITEGEEMKRAVSNYEGSDKATANGYFSFPEVL